MKKGNTTGSPRKYRWDEEGSASGRRIGSLIGFITIICTEIFKITIGKAFIV